MYKERVALTIDEILEYNFKIDTRGYRPQEVDKLLDVVISDYKIYQNDIEELENEKKELIDENLRLKQEIRRLRTKLEAVRSTGGVEVNNADLLRRLSNLEKLIYGKE